MSGSSTKLRLITFDVVNTLIKPSYDSVGVQYAATARNIAGWELRPENLDTAFRSQLRTYRKLHPNYGQSQGMTGEQWWTDVVKNTFKTSSEYGFDFMKDQTTLDEIATGGCHD
jgi:FMN phosphatase YigB (HAD superfamily)